MKKENSKKLLSWKDAYIVNQKAAGLLFKKYPKMFTSRLLWVIWNALTPYVGIYLTALIIEELSTSRNPETLKKLVLLTLFSAALISLVSAFLTKWRDTECTGMYLKTFRIFKDKLLTMDFINIEDTKTQELFTKIIQTQETTGWGLYKVIGNYESILSSIFTLLGGISLTATLFIQRVPEGAGHFTFLNNSLFVFAIILIMLAVTWLAPALSNKAGSYYAKLADTHAFGNRLFGFFFNLGNKQECAADIRIYRQDFISKKQTTDKSYTFGSKGIYARYAKGKAGLFYAASSAVSVIFTGFVYLFVCLKAMAGAFGIGAATQYISAITKVAGSVAALIGTIGDMRNNASFLQLVVSFLEIPNTMQQGMLSVGGDSATNYEIEFRNVSFRYPGSETDALRNVNFKFKAGERLAVVGQNGSGKTTFIKLLCRLYNPTEGIILLNGIDIREYDYSEYMALFSVVFQDFQLFSFPLGQNVGAKTAYDRNLAEQCLRKAGFSERLDTLENGTDTYLYKDLSKTGVDISGGEAQKIALARALYKDAPFIVLDEPTAALDPVAESEIYSHFNEIIGKKTAIYISHRLSSCRFCRDIMVFHEGRLIQRGSHEQLSADINGKYYELWTSQAQYYA